MHGSTDNHDAASDEDGDLATEVISDERSDGQRSNGADRVEGSQETKSRFLRVVEECRPFVENTEIVQHRSTHR